MDWLPNEDAIEYYAQSILGIVRREIPDAELWVVGRKPTQRLQALAARNPGIVVTGEVDDIRPHVHSSSVYVVPLRIGGGTRIKIFEAMAMGKAVVSTPVGAEGLPVQHDTNIVLAESSAEFATQVIRLLKNRMERERIGKAARELVEQQYSWRSVAGAFELVFDKMTGNARGRVGQAVLT
jgi:glycosyltransferase involved in cell wall biosynthesis